MVAEIGLIIGCYVLTRMLEIMIRPKDPVHPVVTTAALLTFLLTGLLTASLLMRGLSGSGLQ